MSFNRATPRQYAGRKVTEISVSITTANKKGSLVILIPEEKLAKYKFGDRVDVYFGAGDDFGKVRVMQGTDRRLQHTSKGSKTRKIQLHGIFEKGTEPTRTFDADVLNEFPDGFEIDLPGPIFEQLDQVKIEGFDRG